jgi:hypothetical protein
VSPTGVLRLRSVMKRYPGSYDVGMRHDLNMLMNAFNIQTCNKDATPRGVERKAD